MMYKLTNSIDHIPNEALKEAYKSFLCSFELYIRREEAKGKMKKTQNVKIRHFVIKMFKYSIFIANMCKYSISLPKLVKTRLSITFNDILWSLITPNVSLTWGSMYGSGLGLWNRILKSLTR